MYMELLQGTVRNMILSILKSYFFWILKDTAITHVWVIQLIGAMVTTAVYLERVGNNTVLTYTRHCII